MTAGVEMPVCAGAGASATGMTTVNIDSGNTTVTVNVTYSGLSGPAMAAHLHVGAPGTAGPVAFAFPSATSPISATINSSNYPMNANTPNTFAAFVTAIKGGQTYINVHTAACGGGEIRADIK
jgi:hypothetical protein